MVRIWRIGANAATSSEPFDAIGDISGRPGAFDAVGDRNPVPGRAGCPGRNDVGGVKRWVHHSWEEGLCLGRVVTGVRVLMWWLVSRIRLSLRCRGVGRLFLLD